METLTPQMILVLLMIAVAVFLFIVEWFRVDVVAILMMVTLPLLHLVTPTEAFIGLSSNAVVSIIAVIIIGAGLDKTGVINKLVNPIVKMAGNSASRIVVFISVTVSIISSFMQNIGAAALFLPAIQRISKRLNIPTSRLLMPIGFCCILGGTITLVGSSPLILLNDLLAPFNLEPFGLFDVAPIGLALVASGIIFFITLGRFVLPKGEDAESDHALEDAGYDHPLKEVGDPYELRTPEDFSHYREPITIRDLRMRYRVNVVAMIEPPDYKILAPAADREILDGIDIVVYGREEDVRHMAEEYNMILKDNLEVFKDDFAEHASGTVEAVVAPRSSLIGKTLRNVNMRDRFGVTPLIIYSHGDTFRADLGEIPLEVGDSILLQGLWKRFQALQSEGSLLFTTPLDVEDMRPEKALFSGFWLTVALVMIIVFKLQLSVCLMTGALGMILTRVISIDEAYNAVDWRTIFLLAGLIPLGVATEKTGTAAWIAHTVLETIGTVSPIVLYSIIGILSTVFTLVISNVGATVLLVPLVVNMALAANADPRIAALVVGLATSNSFILPTHQVNALYMGPGHYRSVDFLKSGVLMSVIFLVVMIAMIHLFY